MCFLPKLSPVQRNVQTISGFGGLNERAAIADNEFSDCYNISPEEYPALGVRDGYEHFDGFDLVNGFQMISAKSAGNIMITEKIDPLAATHEVKAYISDNTGAITDKIIYSGISEEYDFYGFCKYNNELAVLKASRESMGEAVPMIVVYKNGWSPEDNEYYDVSNILGTSAIGVNPTAGFMPFGSRLIIVKGNEIHISYDNDITSEKWQKYDVNGETTAECAQEITLLDDGNFTGCINYRDYPIFFKENSMYILYGEYTPFSLSRIDMVGCPYSDTIAICNGALYFLSKSGVMEYTGGNLKLISQDLKPFANYSIYQRHTACADDRYYYIDDYIFDTYTRTWTKQKNSTSDGGSIYQEDFQLFPQCCFHGELYSTEQMSRSGGGESPVTTETLYRSDSGKAAEWSFTTKQFHEYEAGKKLVSRLAIGFENTSATEMKIEVSVDKGTFQTVYTWDGTVDFAKEVPVILPYCDYFQIRVSGKGKMIIHYIKRFYRVLGV